MRFRILVPGILMIAMTTAHATQDEAMAPGGLDLNGRPLQEVFTGIVTDQTVTVAGHEFYQYFIAMWSNKEISQRYALSVHERPSARRGSQVWIEYAQRRMFHTFLPAARANVKAISQDAVEVVFQNVIDTEVQRSMFHDPDFGADEI